MLFCFPHKKYKLGQNMATKFLFVLKMAVLENCPIMLCRPLHKCSSCMPMDCASCEVLLKRKQHSAMVLAANW